MMKPNAESLWSRRGGRRLLSRRKLSMGPFPPAHLKWGAVHDLVHEVGKARVLFQGMRHFLDGQPVVEFEATTERVGKHFFRSATQEITTLLREEDRPQFRRTVELFSADELARGINGPGVVLLAPCADAVESFEPEADRIHACVTTRADRIHAVLLHALAQGAVQLSAVLIVKVRHFWRWGRRRRA